MVAKEDKSGYPINPDGKRLIDAVVFSESQSPENGVEIFRNVCLGMKIHENAVMADLCVVS